MDELYSYDKIGDQIVIIEGLRDGGYEGIVFKYSHHNPHTVEYADDPKALREKLINDIKEH